MQSKERLSPWLIGTGIAIVACSPLVGGCNHSADQSAATASSNAAPAPAAPAATMPASAVAAQKAAQQQGEAYEKAMNAQYAKKK